MNHEDDAKDLQWLDRVHIVIVDICKHFRSILMIALICAVGTDMFMSLRYQPLYTSGATFAIKANNQYMSIDNIDEVSEISEAFGYIISSNIFKQKVMEDMNVTSLNGYYETSVLENTNIIKIRTISSEPRIAYEMMNSMLERYQDISKLVLGDVNIELMQDISIPTQPFNILSHRRNLMKFGCIGMIGSIVVIGMLSYFSSKIKTREDIENMQLPILGCIPKESKFFVTHHRIRKKKNILITQLSTSFEFIETFKKIRHKIENKDCQVIMITSSLENEGKTSVIGNIALALKENRKKVLVIDGDLRKPAVHKIFELESENHIKDILSGNKEYESMITQSQMGIDFVLGRTSFDDASEKIESEYLAEFIQDARNKYDYILVDSVPSAMFSDATSLAKICDGYILVIRQNFVIEKLLEDTVEKLSLSQVPLIGCILNQKLGSPLHRTKFYGHYYGYRYGYGQYQKRKVGDSNA